MGDKEKSHLIVLFSWAKLNRSQANRVGFTLICGFIAAIVLVPAIGDKSPLITKALVIGAAVIGFFIYGRR
jgi:hypothetical protein